MGSITDIRNSNDVYGGDIVSAQGDNLLTAESFRPLFDDVATILKTDYTLLGLQEKKFTLVDLTSDILPCLFSDFFQKMFQLNNNEQFELRCSWEEVAQQLSFMPEGRDPIIKKDSVLYQFMQDSFWIVAWDLIEKDLYSDMNILELDAPEIAQVFARERKERIYKARSTPEKARLIALLPKTELIRWADRLICFKHYNGSRQFLIRFFRSITLFSHFPSSHIHPKVEQLRINFSSLPTTWLMIRALDRLHPTISSLLNEERVKRLSNPLWGTYHQLGKENYHAIMDFNGNSAWVLPWQMKQSGWNDDDVCQLLPEEVELNWNVKKDNLYRGELVEGDKVSREQFMQFYREHRNFIQQLKGRK